jgi:hypothetical protein
MKSRIECFMLEPVEGSDKFWKGPDGKIYQLRNTEKDGVPPAPVGAMWDADWFHGMPEFQGPDGLSLVVRTPGGDWMIDAPSENGNGWDRTGTPPKITANPSIAMGKTYRGGWRYHGFLRKGFLEEC